MNQIRFWIEQAYRWFCHRIIASYGQPARRMDRLCFSFGLGFRLLRSWLYLYIGACFLNSRRPGKVRKESKGVALPSIQSVARAVWGLVNLAWTQTDHYQRIQGERAFYWQLWNRVKALPANRNVSSANLEKMTQAAVWRIMQLSDPRMRIPQPQQSNQSLRNWLLIWLANAGADAGVATCRSAEVSARLMNQAVFAQYHQSSPESAEELKRYSGELDLKLKQHERNQQRLVLKTEYLAIDLALFGLVRSWNQAVNK